MAYLWDESDPSGTEASDRRMTRLLKLRKDIDTIPLSAFTGGDFEALYRVVCMDFRREERLEDLDRLEARVVEFKAKQMPDTLPPL